MKAVLIHIYSTNNVFFQISDIYLRLKEALLWWFLRMRYIYICVCLPGDVWTAASMSVLGAKNKTVLLSILSLKFSTISKVSVFTLLIYGFFVCSVILYSRKIWNGRLKTIWALKQNGRTVWFKVRYLVIWYPIENLLRLHKSYFLKLRET